MDVTSELTIVIPVRIDSKERVDNIKSIVDFLLKNTFYIIIILEIDCEQKLHIDYFHERLVYYFKKDMNIIFHHTKYRNQLLHLAPTSIVAIWDADVFLNLSQIEKSIELIKEKRVTMCFPYDGRFFFLNPHDSVLARTNIYSFIYNYREGMLVDMLGRPSVGGIFIVNKDQYLKAGGENENFYGWGPEDAERFKRMEILEEPVARTQGPLFHLHHPRGINSTFGYNERDKKNVHELIKVCRMSKNQLKDYIETWDWRKL